MPWLRTGTVACTLNSTTVTGTGTGFVANARVGDAFLGPDGRWYEVANIASDTALSILPAYIGATVGAGAYALAPIQGYVKQSADQLRSVVNNFGEKLASLADWSTSPTPADAREKLVSAKSGDNSDITSLSLVAGSNSKIYGFGDDVIATSDNTRENSFGIENTRGGAPDLHFYLKNSGGGAPLENVLLGGIGTRPWLGTAYSDHSTTALHFLSTENVGTSNQGAVTKVLATPNGQANAGRLCAATFNGYGDVISAPYAYHWSPVASDRGRGMQVVRDGNASELDLISNLPGFGAHYRGTLTGPSGTAAAPAATAAQQATGLSMQGFDGSSYVGAKALITLRAQSTWTTSSTPTEIILATTSVGSTARTDRWTVGSSGNFAPVTDSTYSLGVAALRPTVIYAATGAISTSDAREKTPVRELTDAEYNAGLKLSSELGAWKFLSSIAEKGDEGARWHFGQTVQRAVEILQSFDLDPFSYGCICHDEWEQDGSAMDRYSFRTDELIMLMLAAQARRSDLIESQLAALSAQAT